MEYDLKLHVKKLEKEQIKPKVEKRKITKVRMAIDEIENWQIIKSKSFPQKVNKRLQDWSSKTEKILLAALGTKKESMSTSPTIKQKIVRKHYKQLCVDKLNNLDEIET